MAMHIAQTLAQIEALAAPLNGQAPSIAPLSRQLLDMVGRWLLMAAATAGLVGLASVAGRVFS